MFGSLEQRVEKITKPLARKIDEIQNELNSLRKKQKKISKTIKKDKKADADDDEKQDSD